MPHALLVDDNVDTLNALSELPLRRQVAALLTQVTGDDRLNVIVIEDLNVSGMVRNRHLARAISD